MPSTWSSSIEFMRAQCSSGAPSIRGIRQRCTGRDVRHLQVIGGHNTYITVIQYVDRVFIVVSQLETFGAMVRPLGALAYTPSRVQLPDPPAAVEYAADNPVPSPTLAAICLV